METANGINFNNKQRISINWAGHGNANGRHTKKKPNENDHFEAALKTKHWKYDKWIKRSILFTISIILLVRIAINEEA